MMKIVSITREALKNGEFKKATISNLGTKNAPRDAEEIAEILKKIIL